MKENYWLLLLGEWCYIDGNTGEVLAEIKWGRRAWRFPPKAIVQCNTAVAPIHGQAYTTLELAKAAVEKWATKPEQIGLGL